MRSVSFRTLGWRKRRCIFLGSCSVKWQWNVGDHLMKAWFHLLVTLLDACDSQWMPVFSILWNSIPRLSISRKERRSSRKSGMMCDSHSSHLFPTRKGTRSVPGGVWWRLGKITQAWLFVLIYGVIPFSQQCSTQDIMMPPVEICAKRSQWGSHEKNSRFTRASWLLLRQTRTLVVVIAESLVKKDVHRWRYFNRIQNWPDCFGGYQRRHYCPYPLSLGLSKRQGVRKKSHFHVQKHPVVTFHWRYWPTY